MDTRRLHSFVKIVDIGSLTRAADVLHIAQPALSQQISALEAQFKTKLLVRSKQGVTPTEAGRKLYQYAQLILRQLDAATAAIALSGNDPAGRVSLGLAPYGIGAALSLSLLREVRRRLPQVVLHVNENAGGVLSEAVMMGRLDMALIYDPGPRKGIDLDQMVVEELVLVTRADLPLSVAADGSVQVLRLSELELLLPSPDHTVRQTVQNAVMEAGGSLHVVAETESARTAVRAARAGLGSTILPASVADALPDRTDLAFHRLSDPVVVVTVSLCTSDIHPLTEAAAAVRDIFVELIQQFAVHRKLHGPALG